MFTLKVYLPTNRWLPGFARLFGPDGERRLYDLPCRGKADNKKAAANGNPDRDPTRPWGDTPAGRYEPARVLEFNPRKSTFGRYAILLEGISGPAFDAKENGRTELAIHGNRGSDRLVATYGCLRMFERDIALLAEIIGREFVQAEIVDCPYWPPHPEK